MEIHVNIIWYPSLLFSGNCN